MPDVNYRKVTRVDVAREAGTSVAVVSYVINNGPRPVAEATKQKVLAAIKKRGIARMVSLKHWRLAVHKPMGW